MKIVIVTDAWIPQINGVVNTYKNVIPIIEEMGYNVQVVHPYMHGFKRNKLRAYPEVEYVTNVFYIKQILRESINKNTLVHIATEGPLGFFARRYCIKNKIKFTTCFHTMFPEFIEKRWFIPSYLTYLYFKWFHARSKALFCPTVKIKIHLENKGFKNVKVWTRGVDSALFHPSKKTKNNEKYILCVSRISKEKGLDDFCKLDYPNKVLVGDGPYLESLKKKYPDVKFLGKKVGEELAKIYANAEVFVFPSKADTFGIVILESIASGIPVASYPEPGPREVIQNGKNGFIDDDLQIALNNCLQIDKFSTYLSSDKWSWNKSAQQFIEGLIFNEQ